MNSMTFKMFFINFLSLKIVEEMAKETNREVNPTHLVLDNHS